ncbi:MAG: hypothetical protein DCE90_03050 [Pseudanabaena sp.]|nr:MAG: hypothetical protein DCE90_03050 [Pseudanabaena sp.]
MALSYLHSSLKSLTTFCFAAYLVVLTFVAPANAGKFMSSLKFDDSGEAIAVAVIYETSTATQKPLLKSLKVGNKLMKKALGFKGFALLQSQDGKQVVALSQWEDLDSYQAYTPMTSYKSKGKEGATPPPEPLQTLVFEVVASQTAIEGATPALRGKEAVVRFTQLTPKDPNDGEMRSQLLNYVEEIIEEVVPFALQSQPIPQSVIVLKEVDSGDLAIISNWNCSAVFEDVGKPVTEIAFGDDLAAIADTKQGLYDVVTIIPSAPSNPK